MPTTVRVLVVMDPIGSIKPAKDTTLAMLLAAQQRGWELLYAEQSDLWLRDGVAAAIETNAKYNVLRDQQLHRKKGKVNLLPGEKQPLLPPIEDLSKYADPTAGAEAPAPRAKAAARRRRPAARPSAAARPRPSRR